RGVRRVSRRPNTCSFALACKLNVSGHDPRTKILKQLEDVRLSHVAELTSEIMSLVHGGRGRVANKTAI
ncbi:MAG: hypothetical protein ACUVQR_06665, partial [Thermogutta sp.]